MSTKVPVPHLSFTVPSELDRGTLDISLMKVRFY